MTTQTHHNFFTNVRLSFLFVTLFACNTSLYSQKKLLETVNLKFDWDSIIYKQESFEKAERYYI